MNVCFQPPNKLYARKGLCLACVMMVTLIVGGLVFLRGDLVRIFSQNNEIRNLNKEISLNKKQQLVAEIKTLQGKSFNTNAPKEIMQLSVFTKITRTSGVQIKSLKQLSSENRQGLLTTTFSMSVIGQFGQVYDFLMQLVRWPQTLIVSDAVFDVGENDMINATLLVDSYAPGELDDKE